MIGGNVDYERIFGGGGKLLKGVKSGFTLAEVLITLGIIGVVVAMTLPSLIGNSRKKEIEVKLKKFYSIMTQAILSSEEDNGPAEDWPANVSNYNDARTYYDLYLAKYLNSYVIKKKGQSYQGIYVYLADGSVFRLYNGSCADFEYYIKAKSTDKLKSDLVVGRDYFNFRICSKGDIYAGGKPGVFLPAVKGSLADRYNRTYLLENCKNQSTDNNTCTALIQYDNWEIRDDYPVKI